MTSLTLGTAGAGWVFGAGVWTLEAGTTAIPVMAILGLVIVTLVTSSERIRSAAVAAGITLTVVLLVGTIGPWGLRFLPVLGGSVAWDVGEIDVNVRLETQDGDARGRNVEVLEVVRIEAPRPVPARRGRGRAAMPERVRAIEAPRPGAGESAPAEAEVRDRSLSVHVAPAAPAPMTREMDPESGVSRLGDRFRDATTRGQ